MTTWIYAPDTCDLCGSRDFQTIVGISKPRAMLSDRRIVDKSLSKVECANCGLVRSGVEINPDELREYYQNEYGVSNDPDHVFYTKDGPMSRSIVVCDWLLSVMGAWRWKGKKRCIEIGAGSGLLLQEFMNRFPDTEFFGLEPNTKAVGVARKTGRNVRGAVEDFDDATQFDIAYSIATIEHVSSPTMFLKDIREYLKPGGLLYLVQPTQDVSSTDVFYVDHLHHFGSQHMRWYAGKCGFREIGFVNGHELMPNFSLHLWSKDLDQTKRQHWYRSQTMCSQSANKILSDMGRLDELLERLKAKRRRVAVFGLQEVFCLARSYSSLDTFEIVCGLDDDPKKPEYASFDFPVLRPEECGSLDVHDVILAMNPIYYAHARERMQRLGVGVHEMLS